MANKYPSRRERFEALLAVPPYGSRNQNLLPLARMGRLAGVESAELERLIHAHWDGGDPLTAREVLQAIAKAEELVPLGGDIPEYGTEGYTRENRPTLTRRAAPATSRGTPTSGQRSFFGRMRDAGRSWRTANGYTGDGATCRALRDLSPVRFGATDWPEQAALMVERLGTDWLGFTFAGEQYTARDEDHLHLTADLAQALRAGELEIPPQVMANQLTGERTWVEDKRRTGGGHWSMGTKAQVFHRRHALLEFDGWTETRPDGSAERHPLPLEEQADFWLGCITEGTLHPVALTYSGSKSVHGIIRLLELRDREALEAPFPAGGTWREHYARLADRPPEGLTAEELWLAQWRELEAMLHSAEDKRQHLDSACKDATRLTRLAGHLRRDTGRRQALLYLDRQTEQDLPERPAFEGNPLAASIWQSLERQVLGEGPRAGESEAEP